ncbi:hypothetical protein [Desulfuribacillus alkaliarsenatis]|uniref:Uncharacterized protein n=1 Tax=Desulfuribacillus alkaliarsenatis TaxID=766136 RepID=A0A1E5FZB2_9FIRM|nr:hypothetical protein [Desulfuribacillus alkaliarsenatis]OEF95879.1 hypothetical protein BHF68_10825 [Desulfuribacillus alkaliarsenatis]
MLTIVLLLALLVSFISIIMTVGNALNKTALAKFWALIATASVFTTTFIFIVDSFDLLELRDVNKFATPVNANSEGVYPPGESGQSNGNSGQSNGDSGQFNGNDGARNGNGELSDSRVARIMLLDLFAKRYSGELEGLTAEQRDWLMQNRTLFPASTSDTQAQVRNQAQEVRNLDQVYRSIDRYRQGFIKGTGVVLDKTVDGTTGIQEMQVNVVGPDGGVYLLYYPAVVDLNTGDWVQFYGTPITGKSLRSEFFGTVNSLLVYASYIHR